MAISSQKLLPGSSVGGAIKPIKTSSLSRISPISGTETAGAKTSGKKTVVIKTKVIEIDKLLKGSVVTEKKKIEKERKEKQRAERGEKEGKLESKPSKEEKKGGGLKVPKLSFFDRMKNFIKNIILGFIIVRLIEFTPILQKILPLIGTIADFVSNVVLGIVDGLGTFLNWGFTAWENSEKTLKKWGGDEAVERFNALGDALGNLFNAILIVGMTTARINGGRKPGKKPGQKPGQKPGTKPGTKPGSRPGMKPTGPRGASRAMQKLHGPEARQIYDNARANGKSISQAKAAVNRALRKGDIISKPQKGTLRGNVGTAKGSVMKGGLKKAPGRLATKILGKAGMKAVKGIFGRIPILGPIVVAVASLLAGEPIGQAVFKGLGAAVGGLLGSFIPIPVLGTLLGETLGTFFGDLLYSLILGGGIKEAGEKLSKAIKTAMDVGGLIVNFFKEGFGRFFNDFPTVDVPNPSFTGDVIPKTIAGIFPFLDKDKDGKVKKIPNLSILFNPFAMITELIPHAAKSFFPAIFGAGGTAFGGSGSATVTSATSAQESAPQSNVNPSASGGGTRRGITTPANVEGMEASKKGKIFLHWSAGAGMTGHPDRYHSTILADGSKVQKVPYTQFNTPGGHTAYRNSQGVGLAVAAMANWNWSSLKPEQLDAFTTEAATVAKQMGYSKSMVNVRNIATHAEVASMKDGTKNTPAMRGAKSDPDNYGPSWSGWGGDGTRSDFIDINKEDYNAQKGVGGDKLRAMIKGKMRMGGSTKGRGLYEMGEEGKEYVIDADSTRALQGTFPGLLKALNKAEGKDASKVLSQYASYDMAEVIPIPISQPVPVPMPMGKSKQSFNQPSLVASGGGSFQDVLYKGG